MHGCTEKQGAVENNHPLNQLHQKCEEHVRCSCSHLGMKSNCTAVKREIRKTQDLLVEVFLVF